MKKFFYKASFLVVTILFSSCTTVQAVHKIDYDVAGYNLKSQKEKMQQKILYKNNKTVTVAP